MRICVQTSNTTVSNNNSHPLPNKRARKKTYRNRLLKYTDCSLGQERYEKPENADYKETTKTKGEEQQQTKWEQTGSEMRNRKKQRTKRNDTSEMKRKIRQCLQRDQRDQRPGNVSRIRSGYSRATLSQINNHEPPPECPFCDTKLTDM
jgi:hypothetical protein